MADTTENTRAIRTQIEKTDQREHSTPLFMTSSFVFNSSEHARAMFAREVEGNVYSRYSNPNTDEFAEKMCQLEGAESGISTGSGMAARSEEHTSELQSRFDLVCRLLLDKKNY